MPLHLAYFSIAAQLKSDHVRIWESRRSRGTNKLDRATRVQGFEDNEEYEKNCIMAGPAILLPY